MIFTVTQKQYQMPRIDHLHGHKEMNFKRQKNL